MFLLLFFHLLTAHAETVIVEATPLEESVEASRSVEIITSQDLKRKAPATVADVLRDVPGIDVVRQGPVGQVTSVYIRGARSEDTLVLIDGVDANDVMSPAGGFDFSALSAVNIERIEVYRGPQSVRFGGGALGGVINIVTKEGKGPFTASYFAEGGSYDSQKAAAGVSGRAGAFSYSAALEGSQTAGFSSANKSDGNTEPDGTKIGSASTKVGWHPDLLSNVTASFRYSDAQMDIDRHGGVNGDDPNYTSHSRQILTGVQGDHRFLDGRLKSTLGIFYEEVSRADNNYADTLSSDTLFDSFLSETQKVTSDHEYTLDDHNLLRLNLLWREETGGAVETFNGATTRFARQKQSVGGEGLTYIYDSEAWFGDAGVREDEPSITGTITNGRAALGYHLSTGTRVSATYGTGYKMPSLYQLYSSFGNPSLHGEFSDTWELTAEQHIGSAFNMSLAYFKNRYRNMIDFDSAANHFLNVASAVADGVELQTSAKLDPIVIDVNYTYLRTLDNTTGLSLLRRPQNSANLNVRYQIAKFEVYAQAHYKGDRADTDPVTFSRTTAAAYSVFNIGASYEFISALKFHARVENFFGQKYEEVAGYGTPGLSVYAGLSGEL